MTWLTNIVKMFRENIATKTIVSTVPKKRFGNSPAIFD